ncbi:MAG TPA: Uma2 family endonuclease [Gemmatimonadaceae bacterium]|nr:Uma2 family endonuclease [Gemmatimonadaceae bacterium]
MGMAATQIQWTADMVQALPDDGARHEIIDGELFVTPAPSYAHQRAVLVLARRLDAYVRAHGAGYVLPAPADVVFSDRTLVQPDVFVVPPRDGKAPANWREAGRMLLAVEILSPSSARVDRVRKRALYQREGVPEYWIVDLDARVVERWRPEDERPEILADRIEWRVSADVPALEIELQEIWTG